MITKQQHLELYYYMKLNRMLEEQLSHLYRQGKIVGGLYSSLGQEAISVGSAYALAKEDYLAPMIRNLGAVLVRGFRPRDIITQYMARATSPTRGRDGSSHFGDLAGRHVVAPISMLGDLIPVMAGIGLGARILGKKIVALTWIGDGGSSTGVFHEGLNFAAVQNLPLILIVENNLWAYSTPVENQSRVKDFADKANAYGIPGVVVDGNDVLAVYRVTKQAVDRARAGQGPTLIEAKTMRMKGHAEHDDAHYVPREQFAAWRKKDPLAHFERYLAQKRLMSNHEKAAIVARIERELKEDVAFAEASPFPEGKEAAGGVYCEGCHAIAPDWAPQKLKAILPRAAEAPRQPLRREKVAAGNEPIKRKKNVRARL